MLVVFWVCENMENDTEDHTNSLYFQYLVSKGEVGYQALEKEGLALTPRRNGPGH